MTIFYISGSKINNNRGTIKAIGNNDRSDINNSLTSNTIVNGGSILIDSNSTDPAYSDGIFSFNNNKPLYMPYSNSLAGVDDKKINGNYPIQNRSKTIRSTLTSTAIRQGKYNYFNNTFDTNYPVNTSYDLCPDVLTVTYELGQKQPLVKNDNPSDCDQFETPEPTPCPQQCISLLVPSNQEGFWSTEVNLEAGDTLTITVPVDSVSYPGYPNTICLDGSCQFESTVNGIPGIVIDEIECCNIEGTTYPAGALLARIDDGPIFMPGYNYSSTVATGGTLRLAIADFAGGYEDNLYEYDVNICKSSCIT